MEIRRIIAISIVPMMREPLVVRSHDAYELHGWLDVTDKVVNVALRLNSSTLMPNPIKAKIEKRNVQLSIKPSNGLVIRVVNTCSPPLLGRAVVRYA